jgi:hypothetical protein
MIMQYKVTKRYARGSETPVAEFGKVEEAIHYIQEKLQEDIILRVASMYRLYELGELLKEFTQADLVEAGDTSSGSSSPDSKQSFNPTPINTGLRPSGMPQSGFKDEDSKK